MINNADKDVPKSTFGMKVRDAWHNCIDQIKNNKVFACKTIATMVSAVVTSLAATSGGTGGKTDNRHKEAETVSVSIASGENVTRIKLRIGKSTDNSQKVYSQGNEIKSSRSEEGGDEPYVEVTVANDNEARSRVRRTKRGDLGSWQLNRTE